jgi:hypothetical protein
MGLLQWWDGLDSIVFRLIPQGLSRLRKRQLCLKDISSAASMRRLDNADPSAPLRMTKQKSDANALLKITPTTKTDQTYRWGLTEFVQS